MNKITDKITTFLPWESIEPEAKTQIENISQMSFVFKHVAVMPDCHVGKGATVGTVIATDGAIIPAAVGVDIGCGMVAVRTSLQKEQFSGKLPLIRQGIERRIPLGAGYYNSKIHPSTQERISVLEKEAIFSPDEISGNWRMQLGSLGSGNHFIEVLVDENESTWVVLHSGSRGVGNKIAQKHIDIAKELMKKNLISLKDPDLAYLPEGTLEFNNYISQLHWAQHFALLNREEMMERVLEELRHSVGELTELERINCHHNFTQKENHFNKNVWLTRKGAISAREGERGITPGSMGTAVYLVSGLGNPMSFNSAPHGAGRRFSRGTARKTFTMEQLEKSMEGIEWRKTNKFLDEIPGAYKDINEVMDNSKELVKVDHTLHQLLNVKGD